jgi:DNA polymerase III alpha subunit
MSWLMMAWKRYGKRHKIAKERVDKELGIIDQMDFNSYF